MIPLLMLVTFIRYSTAYSILFNYLPSPNIEIGQSALYQCSVNDTSVSIIWNINGNANIPWNITVTGSGSSSSSLIVPGLLQYNNTVVKCIAAGLVGGSAYNKFNQSTLRIQGKYNI